MYTYTIVSQNDHFPSTKIAIDVQSDETPEYWRAHPLALDLLEQMDDIVEDAGLRMDDYTLVRIECGLETVIDYTDGSVDLGDTRQNNEDRDNR